MSMAKTYEVQIVFKSIFQGGLSRWPGGGGGGRGGGGGGGGKGGGKTSVSNFNQQSWDQHDKQMAKEFDDHRRLMDKAARFNQESWDQLDKQLAKDYEARQRMLGPRHGRYPDRTFSAGGYKHNLAHMYPHEAEAAWRRLGLGEEATPEQFKSALSRMQLQQYNDMVTARKAEKAARAAAGPTSRASETFNPGRGVFPDKWFKDPETGRWANLSKLGTSDAQKRWKGMGGELHDLNLPAKQFNSTVKSWQKNIANSAMEQKKFNGLMQKGLFRSRSLRDVFSTIRHVLVGMAVGGLVIGLGKVLGLAGQVHNQFNQMRLGIGTILIKGGFLNDIKDPAKQWEAADKHAVILRKHMRELARERPGSLPDFMTAFQEMAAFSHGSGVDVGRLVRMAENAVASTKVYGLDPGVVPRDVKQILQGRGSIREIQTPGLQKNLEELRSLVRGVREETDAFQKQQMSSRLWDLLEEGLSVPDPAKEQYGRQFEAMTDTMSDYFREFMLVGGAPVFERITAQFREWSRWLERNEETVNKIAVELGDKVVDAFDWLVQAGKDIAADWERIAFWVKFAFWGLVGGKVAAALSSVKQLLWGGSGGLVQGMKSFRNSIKEAAEKAGGGLVGGLRAGASAIWGMIKPALMLYAIFEGISMFARVAGALTETDPRLRREKELDVYRSGFWGNVIVGAEDILFRGGGSHERETQLNKELRDLAFSEHAHAREMERAFRQQRVLAQKEAEGTLKLRSEQIAGGLGIEEKALKEAAKKGVSAHIDQRNSTFHLYADLRGEDPDAIVRTVKRDAAAESLRVATALEHN